MICPLDRKTTLVCISISAAFVLTIGMVSAYKHHEFKTDCEAAGGIFKHFTIMSCLMPTTPKDREHETNHKT